VTVFDHIIVGAGSAGCVLAERLSRDPRRRVLLLEAGGSDRRLRVQLPIGYGLSYHDPSLNWMLHTEPDPGLNGRIGYWPRGKVLGGSGAINAMVFVRGQAEDFDHWRDLGNPGWGWSDVLPVFRRMERFSGGADAWRGGDGPLRVSDVSRDVHPLCRRYLQAGAELGLPINAGFNGARCEGLGLFEITVHAGRRVSTASAYLRPALKRPNLELRMQSSATRIDFDGRRAVGVCYRHGSGLARASATREVILCAGAVHSPLLLQASGVGPAPLLQSLGIAPVLDSPAVGQHLQDHLCVDHLYRSRVPTLNDELRPWLGRLRAAWRYAVARRGPLALSVNQGGGFVRVDPAAPRPDVQLYFSPLSYTRAPAGVRPLMSPDPFPGFLLSVQPCRPASRGRLRLRSPDVLDAPVIEPGSLTAPGDLELLVEASMWLRRLAAAPALAAVIDAELAPGPAVRSRPDFVDDVRRRAGTVYHPVGTCRMGPDPAEAVVDARLRVHGLDGLRVIDASVFPAITSGNTNAPTIMVAEKGADLVLEDLR
jgi:choline dehydrogenase